MDAVSRARTMVRTGAINFDWDESFDVDVDSARRLSFLVYSWDPHVRHRLCFSGVVPLGQLLEGPRQRLAVALEPNGVLEGPRQRLAVALEPKGVLEGPLQLLAVALEPSGVLEGPRQRLAVALEPKGVLEGRGSAWRSLWSPRACWRNAAALGGRPGAQGRAVRRAGVARRGDDAAADTCSQARRCVRRGAGGAGGPRTVDAGRAAGGAAVRGGGGTARRRPRRHLPAVRLGATQTAAT